MENYISINGQKVVLTDEQVRQILAANNVPSTRLSDFAAESVIRIGNHDLVVLEHRDDGTTVLIRKEQLPELVKFGKSNNYDGSNADEKCQEFAQELADVIGWDNIVLYDIDLTTEDGLKGYGTIRRRASLLTIDLLRRYGEILDKFKLKFWWWLATARSTKRHDDNVCVKCVAPSGHVYGDDFDFNVNGIRPFCILKSDIFVFKGE